MKSCENMAEVRAEIDRVDEAIVDLLHERLGYIQQAGHIKADRETVRDNWRVEDVVAKVRSRMEANGGNSQMIEDVYRFLIEWSINHEFDVFDEVAKGKADEAGAA